MLEFLKNKSINTPADYAKIFKEIKLIKHQFTPINIAILSSYTSEILKPYISVELAKKNYFSDIYFAPFNQFEQEILNDNSDLYLQKPNIVIIHNMIEDMYPNLASNFTKYDDEELDLITNQVIDRFRVILKSLRSNSKASIIVINFSMINIDMLDSVYSPTKQRQDQYIHNINQELLLLCNKINGCYSIDYMNIVLNIGLQNWIDRKLYFMARIPFAVKGQIEFSKMIAKTIGTIKNQACKCLVLDLDNTLWGGVIGEDGMSGIQLSEYYPGNVFKNFQRSILNLRNQGVMLAIASKNNFNDAIEVIQKHPDCIIKESDFAAIQINWVDKALNIEKIAKKLNIGLDSIVFFDDNPEERLWVSRKLPQVKVINVPKDPMLYSQSLASCNYFNFLTVTNEDKNRTKMIQESQNREELRDNSKDLNSFLASLNMIVSISFANNKTLERVSQLINKTNQFNLTTKRYSVVEVADLIESGSIVLYLSVEDCFGNHGISGVSIIKQRNENEWVIDTFLLSCRIIGKRIESVFLAEIINIVKNKNAVKLYGQYIESKKNHLTANFYKEHHFVLSDKNNNIWEYNMQKIPEKIHYIKTEVKS